MCQSLKNTSCRVHSAPGRAYIRYGRCAVCSVFVFCKVHLTCFPLYFINKNCIVFFPKIADLEFCKNLPLAQNVNTGIARLKSEAFSCSLQFVSSPWEHQNELLEAKSGSGKVLERFHYLNFQEQTVKWWFGRCSRLSKWQFASGFCFLFQVVVIDPTHGLSIQSMIFRSVSRPLYRKSFKSDAWRQPNRSLRAERSWGP